MSYSQRVEILQRRGVPENFIEAIAKKKQGNMAYIYVLFLWMAAYIISLIPLFGFYDGLLRNIYFVPASQSDLFFPSMFSAMTSLWLLAFLGLSLPIWGVLVYFFRPARDGFLNDKALYTTAVALRSYASGEDTSSVRFNPKFATLANLPSADAFISAACGNTAQVARSARDLTRHKLVMTFLTQCAVTVLAVLWMHYSYTNIFGDIIEFRTPFSDAKVPLSEITSVTTSCVSAPTRSNNAAYEAHYVVRYNGSSADLFFPEKIGRSQPFSSYLGQLGYYDKYLRSTKAEIKKISADEASPCASYWSGNHPEAREPILRLLTER